MSFEVFAQCFTKGERDGIAVDAIQRAFGPALSIGDGDWWKVFYDEQNNCEIFVRFLSPGRDLVHFLSVHRPCGDARLWDSLLATLKLGNVVLYFPAEKPPLLVAEDSVSAQLPNDMLDSMGRVTRVRCGQDILDEIQKA